MLINPINLYNCHILNNIMDNFCKKYFLENFVCPITRQLINTIGVTSDGKIYEKSIIEKWLKNHNTSPLTGLVIDKNVYNCCIAQNILNNFYQTYPKCAKKRYQKLNHHCDNIEETNDIINNSKFNELMHYTKFDWLLFGSENVENIMKFL